MTISTELAGRIAALGFVDREPIVIGDEHHDELLSTLRRQRIEGVCVHGLAIGEVRASESFDDALTRSHDETMAQTLRVELMSIRVSTMLSEAGIDYRLLKGAALAHSAARNPSDRSFRDVDVLVRDEAIDAAVALLTAAGALRLQPQLRPGFDRRFGKSVTLQLDDIEIDVHRVLSPGPFGVWMKADDLFLLHSTLSIGETEIVTLDRTDNLVHACYHVALGSPEATLVNLRDVAHLAFGSWDHERFAQTIERWRGRAVVRRAVRLVEDQLSIELPEPINRFRHESVAPDKLAALEPYLTNDPRGRFAAMAPATLRALPLSERPAFALAVGLPDGADPLARAKSLLARRRR